MRYEDMPVNAPQAVTVWLANYYPTNSPGETATVIGSVFETYDQAVTWARAKLLAEGVGCVYFSKNEGYVMYPLFEPVFA